MTIRGSMRARNDANADRADDANPAGFAPCGAEISPRTIKDLSSWLETYHARMQSSTERTVIRVIRSIRIIRVRVVRPAHNDRPASPTHHD
jgi:hypothetical protein